MTMQAPTPHTYFDQHFDTTQSARNYAPYVMEILTALGWRGDAKMLRDACPHHDDQSVMGFTDFLNAMAMLGFAPKVINTSSNALTPDMLPCLFIPDDKNKSGIVMLDPAKDKTIEGKAFIFTANDAASDITADKTISSSDKPWFTKLLYRFKGVFQQVFLASLFINILALITPLFMMSVYDKVIGAHSGETLKFLLAGVILAAGVEFTLRYLRSKSLSWFGSRIDYIVSNAVLEKLMSLPASYTERASVAAQLSRLKAFESVREFFLGPLFLSFIEFPFTLILLAAIAIIAGPLVVIPIIMAILYVILLITMRGRLKALTARMATANSERQSINIETLGKQETLRSAGLFDAWLKRYETTSAEASYAGYLYNQSIALIDTLSQGLVILGGVAMIYFGVERIWSGDMSMGAMIAILILTWRTLAPLQMACTAVPRLDQVKRNIDQINRLMVLSPERESNQIAQTAPQFKGHVEFHNVGLRYDKESDPVYAGLSFTAEPGQLIAIVGANSTGKSTTLKLVSGLYHPQAGSVRIDGIDIRQIDPVKLRQNVAYVGQQPEFFSMSLENNLKLVKPDASPEDLKSALDIAGLDEWVSTLPNGLSTMIGHNAAVDIPTSLYPQLALARAYLQDSPIMLIDEMPYEFLNTKAGQKFYEFLTKQKGKRTVFYISYRQDYINLADTLVQLYNDERPQIKQAARNKSVPKNTETVKPKTTKSKKTETKKSAPKKRVKKNTKETKK